MEKKLRKTEVARFVGALKEAVATGNRKAFARLHSDLGSIEYGATVDRSGWSAPQRPPLDRDSLRCCAEGCAVDWQKWDACLLLIGGNWYCRDHHPPREDGSGRYVAYTAPRTAA